MLACILSFLITLFLGRALIPWLHRMKAGQSIREDGPKWHLSKQGTPTMGGIMFIAGIGVAILIAGWEDLKNGSYSALFIYLMALIFGLIGFADDYEKVKKKRNLGLTALQKFSLQLAVSLAFLTLMRLHGNLSPNLYIPFANLSIFLSWPVYLSFAAFVMVATVNAVNITDGVDGLVTGVTMPVALFFSAAAAWWGFTELGVFAAAVFGGLAAFLIYNFHPAKVFYGRHRLAFSWGRCLRHAFCL